jgi:PAS domain S-box-containing protein
VASVNLGDSPQPDPARLINAGGSDSLLRAALESSPQGILIVDRSGSVVLANAASHQMLGYASGELCGQPISALVPARFRAHHARLEADFAAQHQARVMGAGRDLFALRKDGSEFAAEIGLNTITTDDGVFVIASLVDISQRKAAERALIERDEQFRQLTENISDVLFELDAELAKTLYINPAYERVWGRTCQSLYDNPVSFLDAVSPEDHDRVRASVSAVQHGDDPGPIEFRIHRPDGQLRWIRARAVAIRDEHGRVYRIVGVSQDITESRRAQEALIESEARFRLLTEASFDGIAISENGVLTEANEGFARMFGYELDEVISRSLIDLIAEESAALVLRRVHENIEGVYEFVGKRKNGSKINLEAASRRHYVNGRAARLTALRDITEKRSLELQFRQAQKMEAIGRLAGGVAHDFNNLLTVITSYAAMLLEDSPPTDPRRDDLKEIRGAAEAAAKLTSQLLAFSRQQVLAPEVLSVNDVVTGAERMLRRLIGEDIEFTTVLDPDAGRVRADAGQIEQVIMNLAVNARDAMPEGGRLTIETRNVDFSGAPADHYPAKSGPYVMLAVTDSGLGMDDETKARLFEPFFTTKPPGKGTGLGLATVYGIVKQSEGFVWVYSEPGMGTTFKIYLPHVDQTSGEQVARAPAEARGGAETILLVEDSLAVRTIARQILTRGGYRVLEAENGEKAIAVVLNHEGPIHLVLTDLVMPDMGGRSLVERLAELRPTMRVVFMSGYTDDVVMQRGALRRGAVFIQKPFAPDALSRKVREALDGPSIG